MPANSLQTLTPSRSHRHTQKLSEFNRALLNPSTPPNLEDLGPSPASSLRLWVLSRCVWRFSHRPYFWLSGPSTRQPAIFHRLHGRDWWHLQSYRPPGLCPKTVLVILPLQLPGFHCVMHIGNSPDCGRNLDTKGSLHNLSPGTGSPRLVSQERKSCACSNPSA